MPAERRAGRRASSGSTAHAPWCWLPAGARARWRINRAVAGWLEARRAGRRGPDLGDRAGHVRRIRRATTGRPHVQVIDFLDPMADGYAVADLVVSRAGMITVAELCAWGLPSILVPLPTAAADHQTHNARVLADAGRVAACSRRPS